MGMLNREKTVAKTVDNALKKWGRERVIIESDVEVNYPTLHGIYLTYGSLFEQVNLLANGLIEKLGLEPGDRVIVSLTNRLELATAIFAIFKAGGIVVPVNFGLKAQEISYIAENSGAKIIFTEPDVIAWNIKDTSQVPGIKHWVICGEDENLPRRGVHYSQLEDGMNKEVVERAPRVTPDDIVLIAYTSGTTGRPKGAMLSSANLAAMKRVRYLLRVVRREHLGLVCLPLCHIFGLTSLIGAVKSGQRLIMHRFFEPEKVLKTIEQRKVTGFVGVPAMYAMMLRAGAENYDLSSVRYWISGADAMPVEHIKKFTSFGRSLFVEGYGLVETAPIVTTNAWFLHKPGTVGITLPGIKTKIMDEQGNFLKRGEIGELVIRGPNVMKGYWNDSEATIKAFRYGWFHTGDLAKKDRWGYITFVDRKKDVIKCGGYSIFTKEVEEEILEHEAVAEAALIGIPHPTMGELPLAVVSLKEGAKVSEEELMNWCRERIADYKAPRKIKIMRAEEIPRTYTMKILKRELREMFANEFGEGKRDS